MWDVQPTIENRLEIGHEKKSTFVQHWEDPKALTTTTLSKFQQRSLPFKGQLLDKGANS